MADATPGPVAHPGERDRQRGRAEPVGGGEDGLHDPGRALVAARLDVGGERGGGGPRVGRGAVGVLAGEDAAAERGPGQQPDAVVAGGGQQLDLRVPRASSEYSTCADTGTVMLPSARPRSATVASCQPSGATRPP